LNEFALQSDREILFSPEAVTARQTAGVHGRYSPEQALDLLLSGSGLTWRTTENRAILIDAAAPAEEAPEAEESPDSVESRDGRSSNAGDGRRHIEEVV